MQKSRQISLNAARVFEVAARNGSLKLAALELSVTPSAVSHQIKSLEEGLGVVLFERRNNAVLLSDAGRQFLDDIAPAIGTIERAAEALRRSASEVVVRAAMSLAVRWLIPRLESFKKRHPHIQIRLETTHLSQSPLSPGVDLAINYGRKETKPSGRREKAAGAPGNRAGKPVVLMKDVSRPVLSPSLLAKSGYRSLSDIASIPVLSATEDDWDWLRWSQLAGTQPPIPVGAALNDAAGHIRVVDRFDTDDAAIHGAVAGIGMILMPPVMTLREIQAGSLVELPDAPAAELGDFHLLTTLRPRSVVEKFRTWLLNERPGVES
ncbi:LysR family transcriptional regulator [Pelagibius sp. Alg239-R121]|uniref:LysR family transcriptional regulator n=1 Tax=Pelagibius sp. Alg239-R121 TaxID=2993448 RepID=UPI0024A61C3D|nr:LysR family transcriptional regulator [Pelagibius sp. Alg239-R121]